MKKVGVTAILLILSLLFVFTGCSGAGSDSSSSSMSLETQERILAEVIYTLDYMPDEPTVNDSGTSATFNFTVPSEYEIDFENDVGTEPRYVAAGTQITGTITLSGMTFADMAGDTPPSSARMTISITANGSGLPDGRVTTSITVTINGESISISASMNGQVVADQLLDDLEEELF